MRQVTKHMLIKGKVQGVFFRVSAKETADKLGIKGWVKNTADGDVEIVCQGPEPTLLTFINWCRSGPSQAQVDTIDFSDWQEESFNSFEIIRRT